VVGLAGATGVAVAERLTELSHDTGVKLIVLGVQPFACEGPSRREKAIEAIAALRHEADSVLVLSNERLSEHRVALENIRHGFHLMDELLAKTVQALAQVVCKRGLIQLSFADVRSLYGRYAGSEVLENCWVTHVEGSIRDCTEELIEELIEGPLLADESIWKQIDHAIVAVSGTRDLGLSDVQEMVSALKERLPVNIPIATSASLDDDNHDKVRLSVLLAMTAPVPEITGEKPTGDPKPAPAKKPRPPIADTAPLPAQARLEPPITQPLPQTPQKSKPSDPLVELPKKKPEPALVENKTLAEEPPPLVLEAEPVILNPAASRPSRRFVAKQEEMQFEAPTRGRFEKTHETMYRGENLDQPTFRRRGIKIRN
jgi:cell division protein FtsZ